MRLTNLIPLLFVWLWSTGFVGAKYGLPYIEPFFMLFVRFICVIVLIGLIVEIGRHSRATLRQALGQMLVGIMLHGLYLGGVFYAIKQGVPAGISAVIVGLQPILISVLERVFLHQPARPNQYYNSQYIGLIAGFIGITLVVTSNTSFDLGMIKIASPANFASPNSISTNANSMSMAGLIANIVALFGISVGTIIQKRIGAAVPLLSGSLYQYLGAMVMMLILTFTLETQTVTPTIELALALLWLVFGLSILAVVLLMYMIREGEVVKVTSYFYLVPPVTLLQTWWLFDEQLNAVALVGCALTVFAVYKVVRAPTA
ncbi:DMT family transporter [Candidatus Puniceispirillum sp.]|uniref:DMT family transporter n=1 Tax=Candidatus Puniceispirillum sp. TaxID=2026719 RepID=UPI003F6A2605